MVNRQKKYDNLYDGFIDLLREKEKHRNANPPTDGKPILLHKHHVKPKHDGGPEDGEIVICTVREHILAHYIRYKVYAQKYDLSAYYGLVNKTAEKQKVIQGVIIATNRARGNGMFDNKWQKIMADRPKSSYHLQQHPSFAAEIGRKGGQISGQNITPAKLAAMTKNGTSVGTNYGRVGGLKHQNPVTTDKLSKFLEWAHDSGVTTVSPPFESVRELKDYLNCFVKDSITNNSGLSAILRGKEPKRYGWRITQELDL